MDQNEKKLAPILPVYVGVFLSLDMKVFFLEQLRELAPLSPSPESFGIVAADHVTISFRPHWKKLPLINPGTVIPIVVSALAWDSSVMAARVQTLLQTDNDDPHITIAHTKEVGPKYSNTMLASSHQQVGLNRPIFLKGILDVFPRTVDDSGRPLNIEPPATPAQE